MSKSLRAWAELLRVPAVFTVPGDALAGAAAAGVRPGGRTALAVGASLCLYEAGMALNDWADREVDAVERPHRPLPSGRIKPEAALAAAGALTAAGLGLAACAGRRALAVAAPLAAAVWAYDLGLKHTKAGAATMAAARSLDLLLGAAATAGTVRPALAPAAVLGGHTYAVMLVSRHEAEGGSTLAPLTALAATAAVAGTLGTPGARGTARRGTGSAVAGDGQKVQVAVRTRQQARTFRLAQFPAPLKALPIALASSYAVTFGRPLVHAALNPSPVLTQRAVGGGIRAMIALQSGLMARSGAPASALLTATLAPVAARLARKVSTT